MLFQKHSEDCCRQRWSNSVERFRHRVLNLISVLHLIHQTEYGICSGLFSFFFMVLLADNATKQLDTCTVFSHWPDGSVSMYSSPTVWQCVLDQLWRNEMDQALAAQKILVGSVFFFIGSVDRRSNSSSKWVMLYVVFAPMSLSHLTF